MGWFDDVVDFVEGAAEVVVEVAQPLVNTANAAVGGVVGPIAEAVSEIPIVGDVVEAAAPFGGMIGTLVGGPIGGAIGNAVGDAFGDGGGGFDILDSAIGMFGGDLPGPLADIAGDLLGGGSLIDTASSVFGGDIGGIAANLLGGNMPDLGDLGGIAGQVLGGDGMPDFGDLGGIAQNFLGGNMPDLGDLGGIAGQVLGDNMPDLGPLGGLAGQLLGGEGMPDLSDIGGFGGLIKTADSVFGGLGLGNLGSAASGIVGDCMPDLSDPGGWLGNLPDSLPGMGDGGFELPFGCGTFPSIPELTEPISQGGGSWLDVLQQQAGEVAEYLPGGCWDPIERFDFGDDLPHLPDFGVGTPGSMGSIPDPTELPSAMDTDSDLDDLVFKLPGVDRDGAARDALEQLAQTGGLGEALATLSQDDLTTLVTRLVAPAASPAIDTIVDNAATSGQSLDDLGLPDTVTGGPAAPAADDFGDDLAAVGADDGLGGPGPLDGAGDPAAVPADAASGMVADAATADATSQDDFSLGLDAGASDAAGFEQPAPVEFTPEPEPESDFSQQIAQADAVEDSFDSMFDDLGQGQG